MNLESDNELVDRLKIGDKQAFKEVYMKYHVRVFNFCWKLLTDKNEARDIVQHVFISLWEQRERIEADKPIATYIYTLARYTVYQAFRRQVYRKSAMDFLINRSQHLKDVTFEEVTYKELECILEQLIDALPQKRKEIFKLNRTEGLTYKEIAALLNISENTVDTQMRKSLQHLKLEYEKLYK